MVDTPTGLLGRRRNRPSSPHPRAVRRRLWPSAPEPRPSVGHLRPRTRHQIEEKELPPSPLPASPQVHVEDYEEELLPTQPDYVPPSDAKSRAALDEKDPMATPSPLLLELQCSVCHELLDKTVSCASKGHNVCGECFSQLEQPKKCPICRQVGAFMENPFVDRLVRAHFYEELHRSQILRVRAMQSQEQLVKFFRVHVGEIESNLLNGVPVYVLRSIIILRLRDHDINTANLREELEDDHYIVFMSPTQNVIEWWKFVANKAIVYRHTDVFFAFTCMNYLYVIART